MQLMESFARSPPFFCRRLSAARRGQGYQPDQDHGMHGRQPPYVPLAASVPPDSGSTRITIHIKEMS
jgi:hypothetical protein